MTEVIDIFKRVRAHLTACVEESRLLKGKLRIPASNALLRGDVQRLREEGAIQTLHKDGALVTTIGTEEADYEVVIDLGNLPGYYETYDALIEASPADVPSTYTVWEDDQQLDAGYRSAVELLQILRKKGVVWTDDAFFVVEGQVVEFTLGFKGADTIALPLVLSAIAKFLHEDQLDADARWTFFRKALIRLFHDTLKDARLGSLLKNAKLVLERAQEDHSLYLERYSFEDLLKNFEAKRLEFVGNLNQVLAAVQTALVAVPIGFFLIAEKFNATDSWNFQNILLLLGGLAFFALVFVLILNQRKTLANVKSALDDFEADQKEKKTVKQERLLRVLAAAQAHHQRVGGLLTAVQVLLVVFAILLVAGFLWASLKSTEEVLSAPVSAIIRVILRITIAP